MLLILPHVHRFASVFVDIPMSKNHDGPHALCGCEENTEAPAGRQHEAVRDMSVDVPQTLRRAAAPPRRLDDDGWIIKTISQQDAFRIHAHAHAARVSGCGVRTRTRNRVVGAAGWLRTVTKCPFILSLYEGEAGLLNDCQGVDGVKG